MHGLFTNDMILQRNEQVAVYGKGNAGEVVTVKFAGQTKVGTANAQGRWKVLLDPMVASSTGRAMTVTSNGGSNLSLTNILVGDIWILGGQSNMEIPFSGYEIAKNDIVGVNKSQIRLFRSDHTKGKLLPQTEVVPHASLGGKWQSATQTYLNSFSPAGYYMADRLNSELGVPIGLIHAALGSTNIESWLPGSLVASTQEYEFMVGSQWPSNVRTQDEITAGAEMARRGTSGLYNYTVAPLREFGFKGFAWYQGESSSKRPWIYRRQLPDLIASWRQDFGDPNAPFLVVEIAPHGGYNYERAAWLREAQAQARGLANTGYVTTVDIGEFDDIHPQDKKSVGDRLAYTALEMDGLAYTGQPPSYKSMKVVGNTIEIDFKGATVLSAKEVRMNKVADLPIGQDPDAYVVPAGTVAGFEICGGDQVFVAADATISGGKVIVSAAGISNPVAVRYAWRNFPMANLTAEDGRPVPPFRTDNFVGPFHPPKFNNPLFAATVNRDDVFADSMAATDPNGDPLTYALASASGPAANWLSIDASTGVISGRPIVEGVYRCVVSVKDKAFNDADSFNVAYATIDLTVGPPRRVQDDFIYPTPVSTDAGQFNPTTGISKLSNMGLSSPLDMDSASVNNLGNSYVTKSIADGLAFPVTITMTFQSPKQLDAFHLWNHANNGNATQPLFGVKDFDLRFYGDTAATYLIDEITGLTASKAPQSGSISAQTFSFDRVDAVRAVKMMIHSNHGGEFLAIRELGFNAPPPSQFTYASLGGSTDAGQFNAGTGISKLTNMGFSSCLEVDGDTGGLEKSYVSSVSTGWTYPVTLTQTFNSPQDLNCFHLWNHANNNRADQATFGVRQFELRFYSDGAATNLIGSVTGLEAVKAPVTGPIPAQSFSFTPMAGVQAVKIVIYSNHGGSFLAVRELGFGAVQDLTANLFDFVYNPANGHAELSINGAPNTAYKLLEAANLDFTAPGQDPVPLVTATRGILDGMVNEVTTDAKGQATVQFNLGMKSATFIRAEAP